MAPIAEGGPGSFATGGTDGTGSPGGRGRFQVLFEIIYLETLPKYMVYDPEDGDASERG